MGKGKKRREAAERRAAGVSKSDRNTMKQLGEAFFGDMFGELEPLTDGLIDELIAAGWERKPLIEAREIGLLYSRKRNSFTTAKLEFED